MKVKVCPKCGSENKETNESCSSCYASLAAVESTESTREPMVVPPAPARTNQAPRAETPAAPPRTPQSAYGPPPGPVSRPPEYAPVYRGRPAQVRQGSGVGLIVFILILLAGGAGAGWWFFLRSPSPGEVIQQFMRAAEDGDAEKVKSYLSQSTVNMPGFAEGFARGKELAATNPKAEDAKHEQIKILSTTYEGTEKNTAVVTIEPKDKSRLPTGMDAKQEILLVKEEGKWKIDLATTLQRALTKAFGEMGKKGFGSPRGGTYTFPRGGSPTPPGGGTAVPRGGG